MRHRNLWTTLSFGFFLGAVWLLVGMNSDSAEPNNKKKAKAERLAAKSAAKVLEAPSAPAVPEKVAPEPKLVSKAIDTQALTQRIDTEIQKRLDTDKIKAEPRSDDAEFLRRVYLDLVGVIPPLEKVQEFLKDQKPNKRALIIEELLADPRFGNTLAETWTNLLLPRESNNRFLDEAPFQNWLAENINASRPLNRLVEDLLTAKGTLSDNPQIAFFLANSSVDKVTDTVSRTFLGLQLQCAQCHNHPFTNFKQNDYWGMAAFFMKTKTDGNPQKALKDGSPVSVLEAPRIIKNKLPDSAKMVPAKYLHSETPTIADAEPSRPHLARWLTSPENPYFAKAMVNRLWYQLYGRGLVNPVDDMHADNDASHQELLTVLSEQFKQSQFDIKYLVRSICNSEAYQRSSQSSTGSSEVEPDLYSQRVLRVLTPQQLYDSLSTVIGKNDPTKGTDKGGKKGPIGPRQQFVNFFHVEEANPLDYQAGIPQILRLMNSAFSNQNKLAVERLTRETTTSADGVERLFLGTLSRRPTAEETQRLVAYLDRQPDRRLAYSDVLWALVNTSEFVLNH